MRRVLRRVGFERMEEWVRRLVRLGTPCTLREMDGGRRVVDASGGVPTTLLATELSPLAMGEGVPERERRRVTGCESARLREGRGISGVRGVVG